MQPRSLHTFSELCYSVGLQHQPCAQSSQQSRSLRLVQSDFWEIHSTKDCTCKTPFTRHARTEHSKLGWYAPALCERVLVAEIVCFCHITCQKATCKLHLLTQSAQYRWQNLSLPSCTTWGTMHGHMPLGSTFFTHSYPYNPVCCANYCATVLLCYCSATAPLPSTTQTWWPRNQLQKSSSP